MKIIALINQKSETSKTIYAIKSFDINLLENSILIDRNNKVK